MDRIRAVDLREMSIIIGWGCRQSKQVPDCESGCTGAVEVVSGNCQTTDFESIVIFSGGL
jgi:hypothetical protein